MGIASGKADYQGAFGTGTTLRYTPTLSGVKEDVILDAYRGQNTFAFTLNTGNLSVFEEEGRYFIAPTADAEERILISDTWVYDAAGNFEKGTLTVTPVKAGLYLLTVGASVDFLTDENTVYPVYIDSTLTVNGGTDYIEDAGIYQGDPTGNYGSANYFDVGTYSSTLGVGRAVVRLNGLLSFWAYSSVHGDLIDAVRFYISHRTATANTMLNIHPLINESWSASTVTWDNVGQYGAAISNCEVLTTDMTHSFDITDLVYDWKIENAGYPARPEAGFILVSSDETARNRFYSANVPNAAYEPYVTLTYREGIEILHPDQSYRAVDENEVVYVEQGETIEFKVAGFPISGTFNWTVDDTTVATVNSATGELTALSCGTVTLTTTNHLLSDRTATDSIEVEVIPLLSGEYFIENLLNWEDMSTAPKDNGHTDDEARVFLSSITSDIILIDDWGLAIRWCVQYHSAGYYTIQSKETDEYLQAAYNGDEWYVCSSNYVNSNSIRWIIEKNGYGKYVLRSKYNQGLCLASPVDGADSSVPSDAVLVSVNTSCELSSNWVFRSATEYTIINYYDSTIAGNEELIENIEKANVFAKNVYRELFGINLRIVSEPVQHTSLIYETTDRMGNIVEFHGHAPCTDNCGSCTQEGAHHKNVQNVADQLLATPREDNVIQVLWGNHQQHEFCINTMAMSHQVFEDQIANTKLGAPSIQIIRVLGTTQREQLYCMSIALAHELTHIFCVRDIYGFDSENTEETQDGEVDAVEPHNASDCIMSPYSEISENISSIYEAYQDENASFDEQVFCQSCKANIEEQLSAVNVKHFGTYE